MKKSIYSKHAKIFCDMISTMRKAADLTQRELAKQLGREHSFVARIELGERRVDLMEFYAICQVCKTSPSAKATALFKAFASAK